MDLMWEVYEMDAQIKESIRCKQRALSQLKIISNTYLL